DRNRSHWSTSKTPSYTKSVSWQHHPPGQRRCRPAITGNSGTLNEPVVKKINLISFQFGTRNLPTVSL
ncbi:hypothetical protein, partial [Escherichia coli]